MKLLSSTQFLTTTSRDGGVVPREAHNLQTPVRIRIPQQERKRLASASLFRSLIADIRTAIPATVLKLPQHLIKVLDAAALEHLNPFGFILLQPLLFIFVIQPDLATSIDNTVIGNNRLVGRLA